MLSRRTFLKLSAAALGGALLPRRALAVAAPSGSALAPAEWWAAPGQPQFALGRVTSAQAQVMSRPHAEGKRIGWLFRDDVVRVERYVVGKGWYPHNHVWAETRAGYVYSSLVQPVQPARHTPLPALPPEGLFVEVSVPYLEGYTAPDSRAAVSYRLYYAMILQVDGIFAGSDGAVWYRIVDENSIGGQRMFADGRYLRPILPDEIAPLAPAAADKQIRVNLARQRLSAFEGASEVYSARISAGAEYFDPDGQSQGSRTKPGAYPMWSKRLSRHMVGGTLSDGYDLPGVGWVSYFASSGAAIHSTYWHNDFGRPKSHGCLNVAPADAQWLFRWTAPPVDYAPGNVTVQWPGGTRVVISEG